MQIFYKTMRNTEKVATKNAKATDFLKKYANQFMNICKDEKEMHIRRQVARELAMKVACINPEATEAMDEFVVYDGYYDLNTNKHICSNLVTVGYTYVNSDEDFICDGEENYAPIIVWYIDDELFPYNQPEIVVGRIAQSMTNDFFTLF